MGEPVKEQDPAVILDKLKEVTSVQTTAVDGITDLLENIVTNFYDMAEKYQGLVRNKVMPTEKDLKEHDDFIDKITLKFNSELENYTKLIQDA